MPDETYYKVNAMVYMTVRADSREEAINTTLEAVAVGCVAGGPVRAILTDRALCSAQPIEHDAEVLAEMERWLEATQTHPFVD